MIAFRKMLHGAKFAAVFAAALAISACANNPDQNAQANAAGMATPGSQQDFVVNVGDRVFFETDSTDLTPTSRGTREYNIALGARRAQAVREYLASRGVAANRMRTISYGKERPVAVCDDISCWSQNRRAVTVLGGAAGM